MLRLLVRSAVVVSIVGTALPVFAQESPTPSTPVPRQAAPTGAWQPPQNLKQALAQTYWNEQARGPLVAIGAENNKPWVPKPEPGNERPTPAPVPLVPPDRNGYQIEKVAPYFGNRTVRLPSLTVVAPGEMTLLNTNLKGKPDPFAGMRGDEKLPLLLATLEPAQWKALGSAGGLGLSDLDEAQKALFLSLFPDPLQAVRVQEEGGNTNAPPDDLGKTASLSGANRSGARLRMTRTASLIIPTADGKGYGAWMSSRVPGSFYWSVPNHDWDDKPEAFGTKLKAEFPNKLKPGDLLFDSDTLSSVVSVAGVKNVAGLIKRIHDATGLELYADGRAAALSVTVLGDSVGVRASDLCKALCWAVTGTWRQVGPAFVLTQDVKGIAVQRVRIREWMEGGERIRREIVGRAQQGMKKGNPLSYLSFDANDPLTIPPSLMAQVENAWKQEKTRVFGATVRTAELPGSMQQMARSALEEYNKNTRRAQNRPISPDRVRIDVKTRLTCLLPGVAGEADMGFGELYAEDLLAPITLENREDAKWIASPVALPRPLAAGSVLLWEAQRSAEPLTQIFAAAKERGIRVVWLQLPLDESRDRETLVAALQAAKEQGITLLPAVRLWSTPPKNSQEVLGDRDTNLLGETGGAWAARRLTLPEGWPGTNAVLQQIGDYSRPDAPDVVVRTRRRLLALAQVPGVTGIVLTGALSPGYTNPKGGEEWDSDTTAEEMGYTLENRLAFLRQHGSDPIDFWGDYSQVDWTLPFWGSPQPRMVEKPDGTWAPDSKVKNIRASWNKMRYEKATKALRELFQTFRAQQPKLPLILRDVAQSSYNWYGTWEAADKLPSIDGTANIYSGEGPGPQGATLKAARAASKTVWFVLPGSRALFGPPVWADPDVVVPGSPPAFRRALNEALEQMRKGGVETAWDGLVLDMIGVPTDNLLGFLHDTGVPAKGAGAITARTQTP